MEKDFDSWNTRKKEIEIIAANPFFSEREIWFLYLGTNIGAEQDGSGNEFMRPVVIVRKFNNNIFWAVPLTRTQKESPYYFSFVFKDKYSTAILSQLRLADAYRLSHKIGYISSIDFESLKQKLKALLP